MNPSYEPIHNAATTGVSRRALLFAQGHKTLGSPPPAIDELGSIFAGAGHRVSLVGGPVHGTFLGLPIRDFDLAMSAPPEITEELLSSWGVATWDVGREFGVIGSVRNGVTVEVTTYRSDSYGVGSRRPKVDFGRTLEGDLSRHDFTVSAMAVWFPELELVDPCGGLDGFVGGVLRTPVAAIQSLDDDPLRIMRAARFAAQLGFGVGGDVVSAMAETAERLAIVSAERIRAELERLMLSPAPRRRIELLVHTGVAGVVLPEIAQLRETVDEHKRHKNVYKHTLAVVDQAIALEDPTSEEEYETYLLGGKLEGPDLTLRLTALSHDVGKPHTRRFGEDGSVAFRVHDVVSARMVAKRMAALRFDRQARKDVTRLVELHLHALGLSEAGWTDSVVRRFVCDAGDLLPCLMHLTHADVTSQDRRRVDRLRAGGDEPVARIRDLAEQGALDAIRPDLNGARIVEILGLKPGPEVGAARNYLLKLRLDEGPLGEEEAKRHLLVWWPKQSPGVEDSVPVAGPAPGEP